MTSNRSRTRLSFLNILSGFANRFLVSLLKLLGRVVFFRFLSAELYGVSGLFSNVLGLLSLAELGVGNAITFSLYSPIAEGNEEKIRSLMAFYKKAYRIIALSVLALGLALIPFLPSLTNGGETVEHFYLIYLLFLANTVIEYLFSYKRTLANAAQEGYRLVPFTTGFEAALCLVQIAVIVLLHKAPYCFLIYLAVQTLSIFLQNVVINLYLDKTYPLLKSLSQAAALEKEEKHGIFVNVRALMMHKFGGVVVSSTDNLLISKLLSLVTVGLYSNYSALITSVSGIVYLFVGNTTSSFGNLIAAESPKKREEVFFEMQFFSRALYGFSAAFLFNLFRPFISFAYGEEFCLSFAVTALLVANYYLLGMTYVLDVVKSAAGLYDKDKFVPLLQSAVNLTVSIVLGKAIGLSGIFIGTLVSTLVPLISKPVVVFPAVFEASPLSYFKPLLKGSLEAALMCLLPYGFSLLLPRFSSIQELAVSFFVTAIVAGGVFLAFNFRSPHLPALFHRVKHLLKR